MSFVGMESVVINVVDVDRVVGFWKGLLGVDVRETAPGFVWLDRQQGATVSLAFQQVDDPTEGRNRLHIDFGTPDVEDVRARVLDTGGQEIESHEVDGFAWTVFADPEGNEFCVAQTEPDQHA